MAAHTNTTNTQLQPGEWGEATRGGATYTPPPNNKKTTSTATPLSPSWSRELLTRAHLLAVCMAQSPELAGSHDILLFIATGLQSDPSSAQRLASIN